MTNTEGTSAICGRHLRELLESTLPNPALVVAYGRTEVVADAQQAGSGLEVVSREQFLRRTRQAEFSDAELERYAHSLSAIVDNLGG